MTFALLAALGLSAGFAGLAWGYFVLGPRERVEEALEKLFRAMDELARAWNDLAQVTRNAEYATRRLNDYFMSLPPR